MSDKRYTTIAQYQRATGLSYQTIKYGLESGQIRGVRTACGNWKIDTEADTHPDISVITQQLDSQGRMLRALCGHLGVQEGARV